MKKPKAGRPPLPPGERRVTLTVRVKPATKAKVERLSRSLDKSQGDVVDDAIDA